MVFLRSLPDSPFVIDWQCSEVLSTQFFAIQTHLSHRFYLAMDFPGLRRNGSSSQIIDQAQDIPEQAPRHRHLGQLERDVPAMTHDLGPDLDQPLP